jgi:hypothetical protein
VRSIRPTPILRPNRRTWAYDCSAHRCFQNRLLPQLRISNLHDERGFSLIEILIGSAVFIIALCAIVGVLQVSQLLHSKTQQGLELEQNVRSALNIICRELINAGSGVPYLTTLNGSPAILAPASALLGPLGNALHSGSTYFITPCHETGATVTKDGEGNDLLSPIHTDMLVFFGGTGTAGFINQNSPGPSANWGQTVYLENNSMFSYGQVVLISNGFQVSLGQITRILNNGGLEFSGGVDSLRLNPGSSAEVPNPNMTAAQQISGGPPPQVFPLSFITYFIDATTNPAHPSIKRLANSNAGSAGAVEVADDIENLQITYLVDDDANATTPAMEIAAPSITQMPLIRGVTVSITGRSHIKMGDTSTSDRHSRITLSQTVFFRNNIRR